MDALYGDDSWDGLTKVFWDSLVLTHQARFELIVTCLPRNQFKLYLQDLASGQERGKVASGRKNTCTGGSESAVGLGN